MIYWWLYYYRAVVVVAALQPDCEEMEREWGNVEEMERKWGNGERLTLYISSFSLHFLPLSPHFLILSPFPPSLSISYIKICYILSQNVKYGIFVANVTKILTYALWGNNSGSNLLRGSLASCAGLERRRRKKSVLPCLQYMGGCIMYMYNRPVRAKKVPTSISSVVKWDKRS